MPTPEQPNQTPSDDQAASTQNDNYRDSIQVGNIGQSEGVAIGAGARATVTKNIITVFGPGSASPTLVTLLLIALLSFTSVLLAVSLSVPNPSPFLRPLALIFGCFCVGLSVIQYWLRRPQPQLERNRIPLLRRTRRWVSDQLGSVTSVLHIQLNLVARPDAMLQPYEDQAATPASPAPLLTASVIQRFDDSGGSLLILGSPGSGKTTLLLELAQTLVTRAEQQAQLPIPIVFKLSFWDAQRDRSTSLAEWLIHELVNQYEIPREFARSLLANNQLLPLLDGLDDVLSSEHRELCAQAIMAFHHEHTLTPIVVTCRTAEYADLQTKLRLDDAIELQPLSDAQIDTYLEQLGPAVAGLRTAIAADTNLRELARTLLILTILAQIANDSSAAAPIFAHGVGTTDPATVYKQLFDAYLELMLKRPTNTSVDRAQIKTWLVTLARGMRQNAQQVFLIERLQPIWLTRRDRIVYALLDRLAAGLAIAAAVGSVVGLSYGFGYGLSSSWHAGLIAGFANGARFGLVAGLVAALLGRTADLEQVSVGFNRRVRDAAIGALAFGASGALFALLYFPILGRLLGENFILSFRDILADLLFFGLVGAVGGAVLHGPDLRPRIVSLTESRRWSWSRGLFVAVAIAIAVALVSMYVYGRQVWLIFGLVYGLSVWVLLGITAGEVEPVARPNGGIWRSARSASRVGLAVGLASGCGGILGGVVIGQPYYGLIYGLSSAALVGLFGAIVGGAYACISHLALRVVLWRSGILPWNLEAFLDDAAQRIILRRAGGSYTFIHRLLLEHIAELAPSADNPK